jgi:hypothetical protein
MPADRTSGSSTADETYCVGCERGRGAGEPGWVVVRGPANSPRAAYCPECMTSLVREASGESAGFADQPAGTLRPRPARPG